jgi:hypothetical protein
VIADGARTAAQQRGGVDVSHVFEVPQHDHDPLPAAT